MTSLPKLKQELDRAAKIKNPAERGVIIAAIIAAVLRPIGQDPVLVGGAAVEFYTQGGYSTADIDMVAPGGEDLKKVMQNLGFKRMGKDFIDERRKIYIEFHGSSLKPSERVDIIEVGSLRLKIIAIEDLIVDRLCAFKFWKSALDGVNALMLIELGKADEMRLQARVQEEEVQDALKALREIREEAIRKKLTQKKTNALLEKRMHRLK